MNLELFKSIVSYYGEENILGVGFDNSAGTTFGKGEFTLSNYVVEDIECLQIIEFDRVGNPYHVIKPIETIQAIYVRDAGTDINAYDRITIRG